MPTATATDSRKPSRFEEEFRRVHDAVDVVPTPQQFAALATLAERVEVTVHVSQHEGVCRDSKTGEVIDTATAALAVEAADPRPWLLDAAEVHQAQVIAAIPERAEWRSLTSVQRRTLTAWRLRYPDLTYGNVLKLGRKFAAARLDLHAALVAREHGIRLTSEEAPQIPAAAPEPVRDVYDIPVSVTVNYAAVPVVSEPGGDDDASGTIELPATTSAPDDADDTVENDGAAAAAETVETESRGLSEHIDEIEEAVELAYESGREQEPRTEELETSGDDDEASDLPPPRPATAPPPNAVYAAVDRIDLDTLEAVAAEGIHPPVEARGFIRIDPYGTANTLNEIVIAYIGKLELQVTQESAFTLCEKVARFNRFRMDDREELPVGLYIWFPGRETIEDWLKIGRSKKARK